AAVDAPVTNFAAVGGDAPRRRVLHGELVQVPVEDEVTPLGGTHVTAHQVGHVGLGRQDLDAEPGPGQHGAQVFGNLGRVSGRVVAGTADRFRQDVHEMV